MVRLDATLQKQLWRGARVAAILLLIVLAFMYVLPLVYPFLFGWLIAYMLGPLVGLLQRKARMPRWLAATIMIFLFIAATAAILTLLVTNLIVELGSFAESLQTSINTWKDQIVDYIHSDMIQGLVERINTFYDENPQYHNTINSNLSSTAKMITDFGSSLVGILINSVLAFLTSLPKVATLTIIALLAAFFMSKDWFKWADRIAAQFSENTKKTTRVIWNDLQKALFGYVRAQLILISLTAVVNMIGLMILKVDYAITIGLLIGLVDLMPYLGVGAAMVPWIVYTFVQGDIYLGIGLSVLYGVVLVTRQIMEPKVLATSVGLNPLPLLFAMYIGLKLFGVLGLIYGPVILIVFFAFQRAGVFRDIRSYIVNGKNEIIE
ncbi:MAG: sporulation integral membrane protein YtvI [Paenibacillaceae bacterium]|nr:sporulation integral membrane protein YtvI [Paenibacillaceae bacterium]